MRVQCRVVVDETERKRGGGWRCIRWLRLTREERKREKRGVKVTKEREKGGEVAGTWCGGWWGCGAGCAVS